MAKNSAKDVKSTMLRAKGKLPAKDEKLFGRYVEAIITQWGITRPVDVMIANRMVSSWMKMRYAEDCIDKYGMFFEDKDDNGNVCRIRMNELAYYLKQLEADFRSYYRVLQASCKMKDNDKPESFLNWLEVGDGKTKVEKSKG